MMDTASYPPVTDPDAIRTWADIVFGYLDGLVAVRLISEKGTPNQKPVTAYYSVENLADELVRLAPHAFPKQRAVFVVPGTVDRAGSAKVDDIRQTGVLLADLDDGDIDAKRNHLVLHLGGPTLEVASGGRTDEGQIKRHLFWRLTEVAAGPDLKLAVELRALLAHKSGSDSSFAQLHQPIRVAGTVHGKYGVLSPVRILARSHREVDLAEFAEAVRAMPALPSPKKAFDIDPGDQIGLSTHDLMTTIIHEGGGDEETRFSALSKVIGHWIRQVRSRRRTLTQAWEGVCEYNEAMIRPPWDEAKLRGSFLGILKKDIRAHGPMPEETSREAGIDDDGPAAPLMSDDHLGARFVALHGKSWKHVPLFGSWYAWTGTHWSRDEVGAAFNAIRLTCRGETGNLDKPAEARRLASTKTIQAVQRIAASDPAIARSSGVFDQHPMLLNTPTGIMDLATGSFLAHDRDLLLTQLTRASPGGGCPRWLAFLETITDGDTALQAYLARVAGYCLTGSTREQVFFFLHGSGANGKSVFLQTIAWGLGSYTATAAADTFTGRGLSRHLTELAGLRAARMVLVSETEAGESWAEARIKSVTGGETIRANFMYRDHFEFLPQFKLLVAGNHRPAMGEVGEAMRRRLHLIPFAVTIPPEDRDADLGAALQEEADGILGWMIDGCADWLKQGLNPPGSVVEAAKGYFEAEDQLGHWIDERCTIGPDHRATAAALFASWSDWARSSGQDPQSARFLGESLRARGFMSGKVDRKRGWLGIGLHPIFIGGAPA